MTPAPLVESVAQPFVTTPARAFRNREGLWLSRDIGKLAIGGVIDQPLGGGYAISNAWRTPGCGWCFQPEFRRMVPNNVLHRSPDHGPQTLPADDPFPMTEEELGIAADRDWPEIAKKVPIPHRYRKAHLLRSEQTPAIRAVRDFVDDEQNDARALVLAGPTGTGKTWAHVAAFRHEAVQCDGKGLEYWTMGELVRKLISEESDEVLERCIKCDTLYLDDLGAAYLKEGGVAEALIEEIIVVREADLAPMFCTTNLTLPRLAQVLGDRVADRLCGSWADWVALPGASLRKKTRPRSTP